ncbi:hypothetical protein P0Y67_21130 [Photobacterium sp. SP02]|uniref:hypothetical protein n=1 Tax=Photobacterium sp. SP02 TaxID=3032280 RepID=UPI003144E358
MAELSTSRIYLMGRIHNIDGDVSRGSKLFDLPYESLVFGGDNWYGEFTYNSNNQSISK